MSEEIAVIDDADFRPVQQSPTLFGTDEPVAVVEKATAVANALADVVRNKKLATSIQGREHVRVEGWTLLGSMLGVFPIVVWTRELDNQGGWEARVEARTRDGAVVGAAEAECRYSEKTWRNRESYALRSMAQTRATSKALRHPLGFVMTIAGFEATPEDEMPRDEPATPATDDALRERENLLVGLVMAKNGNVEDLKAAMKVEQLQMTRPNYVKWLAFQEDFWEKMEPLEVRGEPLV